MSLEIRRYVVVAFVLERLITLRVARGKTSIQSFFRQVVTLLQKGDYDGAIAACDKQRGSCANILRAGIERYQQVSGDNSLNAEKRIEQTQTAIEEANALEVPLLERNLIALSTIASIATMVGLLGTTIGMIRAFAATAGKGGVIDAEQLVGLITMTDIASAHLGMVRFIRELAAKYDIPQRIQKVIDYYIV